MLAPQFRLRASHQDDLAAVCRLGVGTLDRVTDELGARPTIQRSRIEKTIIKVVGETDGAALTRALFGIASTFRRFALSPSDAVDMVESALGDTLHDDERFHEWRNCKAALTRLLETKSIFLAAKALDISYDFERVFLAGRVLTSVRPVFDRSWEEIVGSAIVQTLRLEFLAPNGDQSSISVAVDLEDLRTLKEECERAIEKALKAKKLIQERAGFDAIIAGEETNE